MTTETVARVSRLSFDPIFKQPRLVRLARGFFRGSFPVVLIDGSLDQKRERSAVRRIGLEAAPATEPHRLARPVRLTALHLGVIRWWDPSASPACRSSLGSGHLTRQRDGRFHPRLHDEPGGLLHTSPGNRLARPVRGSPSPFTLSLALQSVPQRMGMTPRYSEHPTASSYSKNYL